MTIQYQQNTTAEAGSQTSPITTAAFGSTNTAGNSIIVTLGTYTTSSITLTNITDTQGNTYVNVVPQYTGTGATKYTIAMYWCPSVIGGSGNQVIGHWTGGTTGVALYAIEYSGGLKYFDTGSANDANAIPSATSSSGNFTTTRLGVIVSTNIIDQTTNAHGANYTQRLITAGNGDILEDWIGAPIGVNNASASLNGGTQDWIQVAGNFTNISPNLNPTDAIFFGMI